MAEGRKPPKRTKSTVRPYLSETLLAGVRKNRADLDYLTEREFIEAALLAFQQAIAAKPLDQHTKHQEIDNDDRNANPATGRADVRLADPTDLDF